MSLGKRLSGLILVGLGALGMAVCLAGIAGLWIGAAHLQRINSQVFGQVDRLVVQVDQRAAQAGDAVGGTRELVEALKRTLKESTPDLLAGRVASLPKIDSIERRVAAALERTDDLMEASASTAELIDQLLVTIGDIAPERSIDRQNSSDLMATIRSTRESLAKASERLADVERRLTEIRQKEGVDVDLSEITKLSLGLVAKLDVVQSQIAAFRSRLDATKSRSAQLQKRISSWIRTAECLITLPIAWVGAGQFCLLFQSWRLLRRLEA